MPISLDDLDYFNAVVDAGQVRGAALALGISQPAITKGIQRLERELGFPLFERSAKGMALTAVAEQFHRRVRSLRGNLRDAINEATGMHLGTVGTLRAGVSPLYLHQHFLPACLQLTQQRPAATLRLTVGFNDKLVSQLLQGDLDLAVCAAPAALPDSVHSEVLVRDDLCMVARHDHPLLSLRRPHMADLLDAGWVVAQHNASGFRILSGRLAEAGLPPPRVVMQLDTVSPDAYAAILVQSDLVSAAPESLLPALQRAGVVMLPLPEARFQSVVCLLTRNDVRLPPLASRLIEILREQRDAATLGKKTTRRKPG